MTYPDIIVLNRFGNYEHLKSGLVFDIKRKLIIGKQSDDGFINYITKEDIDKCKQFKFSYDKEREVHNEFERQKKLVLFKWGKELGKNNNTFSIVIIIFISIFILIK